MTAPRVQLWLLCRNRPDMGREALESCLRQDYPNFEVIVSDNSTSHPVDYKSLGESSFRVVKRPDLSGERHYEAILREVGGDYFALAHDDDILLPNFLSTLVAAAEVNKEVSCVIGNAWLMIKSAQTNVKFNSLPRPILLTRGRDLFQRYFRFDLGSNPLPAALYRGVYGRQMRISHAAGKYSDTAFLEQMFQWGYILYLSEPVMHYRRHGLNDSAVSDTRQGKRLVNFAVHRGFYGSRREFDLLSYRIWMLFICAVRTPHRLGTHQRRAWICIGKFSMGHPIYMSSLILTTLMSKFRRRWALRKNKN